jgi:predicted dehydrogenase
MITETIESARQLVAAADKVGVPFIVGHHRRYNPGISRARRFIQEGGIGKVTAVNCTWFRHKPDDYFRRLMAGNFISLHTAAPREYYDDV